MATFITRLISMSIARRLATLRKQKGLTQQAWLTPSACISPRSSVAGTSQPSLEALKKLAKIFRVTTDSLIFEPEELEPDEDLRLQFKAVSNMPAKEQQIVKQLLEGMIIKYEAERWSSKAR